MSTIVRRKLVRYRTPFSVAGALALVLAMFGGVVGPDVVPPPDNSTTVTVTTILPRVMQCQIWSQGPNGAIELGAIGTANPAGDDVNRTSSQVQVGLLGDTGGAKSQSAVDPDDQLYLYVKIFVATGNLDSGGIKDVVNVTIKGWFQDEGVSGSDGTYTGYDSTPGKNSNFIVNYFGTKANTPENTSAMFWPNGTTHSPNGTFREVGLREVAAGQVGFTTNVTALADQNNLKIGIPISFNNNFRWAKNSTASEAWKVRCLVGMKASAGHSDTPDVYSTHQAWYRYTFGAYKHSRFAVSGSFAGTFAPGGTELPFPTSPQQTIYYFSNAPFNLSVNISDLRPTLGTGFAGCPGPTCIDAQDLGVDVGQTNAANGAGGLMNCNGVANSCWRFFWDNTSVSSTATGDGYTWARGGNGSGLFSALGPGADDAGIFKSRWLNTTCGSEEWDPDISVDCLAGSGFLENEDITASWFAQIDAGVLEGTYTTRITYRLATHPNATPRTPWAAAGGDQT